MDKPVFLPVTACRVIIQYLARQGKYPTISSLAKVSRYYNACVNACKTLVISGRLYLLWCIPAHSPIDRRERVYDWSMEWAYKRNRFMTHLLQDPLIRDQVIGAWMDMMKTNNGHRVQVKYLILTILVGPLEDSKPMIQTLARNSNDMIAVWLFTYMSAWCSIYRREFAKVWHPDTMITWPSWDYGNSVYFTITHVVHLIEAYQYQSFTACIPILNILELILKEYTRIRDTRVTICGSCKGNEIGSCKKRFELLRDTVWKMTFMIIDKIASAIPKSIHILDSYLTSDLRRHVFDFWRHRTGYWRQWHQLRWS